MTQGLNIDRLVRVSVNLEPLPASDRNFGVLMIIGDSDVINGQELIRQYFSLDEVAADFGTIASEYLGAQLYFGQNPQPQELFIGRWLRTATAAQLTGGILTSAEQDISNWTSITDGTFEITTDAVLNTVTALDFSLETNLNGVASIINASVGLTGGTISWNGTRFVFVSDTTGATSTITYASVEGTGTDISAQLKMTVGLALAPINGFDATTALQSVVDLADFSTEWYGCTFASSVIPSDSEIEQVALFIEAALPKRVFGINDDNTGAIDQNVTTDLGTVLSALDLIRTFGQYSTLSDFPACSFFGRAATVDFTGSNTTITMMYKQEPGVLPEILTTTQANTLKNKRYNVLAKYNNDTDIIQYGAMFGQAYFDEVHGLDWFSNALQSALYNLLFTTNKVPQTESGQNKLVNAAQAVCDQSNVNGLVSGGVWNQQGFGTLSQGDYLPGGYYIFSSPIAAQTASARASRTAPLLQIALKLAGAIQEIDVIVDVNR